MNDHGWSKEKADRNIFEFYHKNKTRSSSFDSKSIMLYEIPVGFALNGYSTSLNKALSETDKEFIAQARFEFRCKVHSLKLRLSF